MQLQAQSASQGSSRYRDDDLTFLNGNACFRIKPFPDEFFDKPHLRRLVKIPFEQQIFDTIGHYAHYTEVTPL